MDEPFADIFALYVVFISGEPGQSLLEHVNPQGVIASYNDVDP